MAIFNSYVSLPEVNIVILCHITEYDYMMYEQTVVWCYEVMNMK